MNLFGNARLSEWWRFDDATAVAAATIDWDNDDEDGAAAETDDDDVDSDAFELLPLFWFVCAAGMLGISKFTALSTLDLNRENIPSMAGLCSICCHSFN